MGVGAVGGCWGAETGAGAGRGQGGDQQVEAPVGRALVSGATLWHLALGCPSLQGARRPWTRGTGPRLLPAVLRALLVWPAPARDPAMFCGGGCTWASPSLRGTAVGQAPSMPHPRHPKAQPSGSNSAPARPGRHSEAVWLPTGAGHQAALLPRLWGLGPVPPL